MPGRELPVTERVTFDAESGAFTVVVRSGQSVARSAVLAHVRVRRAVSVGDRETFDCRDHAVQDEAAKRTGPARSLTGVGPRWPPLHQFSPQERQESHFSSGTSFAYFARATRRVLGKETFYTTIP